ncbi:MAG: hypothetical protein PHT00_02570 [Candidatus Methanomethylophilus sp.]|nr:hypothetical protein [Methanomethylophilus sp.]MDD4222896.1 hypothetical protein [Methanomethylophilus sp.]
MSDEEYKYRPTYHAPMSPQAPMYLTPEETSAGITPKLKVATHRFMCPVCGKEFSLFQSRAVACKYCPKASSNCPNIRCPYCDSEFPLSGFVVPNKKDQVTMNQYADRLFDRWADTYNRR